MPKPKPNKKNKKKRFSATLDPVKWVSERERVSNQQGLASRDLYQSHRERLTQLIAGYGGPGQRLCLLGAGNCNDVELSLLSELFSEVHLVDIDREAVLGAKDRTPPATRDKVFVHAPFDLSGLLPRLPALQKLDEKGPLDPQVFAQEVFSSVESATHSVVEGLPGPFDTCVSCCLTTQLSWALSELLTRDHPRIATLRMALLLIHTRVLLGLKKREGRALWVSDVSSTSLYPIEEALRVVNAKALVNQLVEMGKVYGGGNPRTIEQIAGTIPDLSVEAHEPWLWKTKARTYLVSALELTTRSPELSLGH